MLINADSAFVMGDSHRVCQDYACHGIVNIPGGNSVAYAAVCDGCSSSEDTDIGSRLLALSFVQTLPYFWSDEEINGESFLRAMVLSAHTIVSSLKAPPECLDSTLMGVATDGDKLLVMVQGDGFVDVAEDGLHGLDVLEYDSGAPFYANYLTSAIRKEQYEQEFPGVLQISSSVTGGIEVKTSKSCVSVPSLLVVRNIYRDTVISLMSDGAASFVSAEREAVPAANIVEELTSYRNFHGEFVRRRFNKALKGWGKNGFTHFDDLSCAALCVRKEADESY